ncbi:MAG TPA: hypothetical protein PL001_00130 [Candidatus Kryptobacter bacterium]|nr:hypothetical protein [Candidatus Kryptobacter bacterium]
MQPGDIVVVGGLNDFLSRLIYWASSTRRQKCIYSHTEIAAGTRRDELTGRSMDLVFGAKALVMLDYWKPYPYFRVYGWADPQVQVMAANVTDELIPELNDKVYGLQQYLFFGWRKLCNSLRLPKRWAIHQWFNGDYICTTVCNIAIRRIARRAQFQVSYPYGNGALTPLDIVNICNELVDRGIMIVRESR